MSRGRAGSGSETPGKGGGQACVGGTQREVDGPQEERAGAERPAGRAGRGGTTRRVVPRRGRLAAGPWGPRTSGGLRGGPPGADASRQDEGDLLPELLLTRASPADATEHHHPALAQNPPSSPRPRKYRSVREGWQWVSASCSRATRGCRERRPRGSRLAAAPGNCSRQPRCPGAERGGRRETQHSHRVAGCDHPPPGRRCGHGRRPRVAGRELDGGRSRHHRPGRAEVGRPAGPDHAHHRCPRPHHRRLDQPFERPGRRSFDDRGRPIGHLLGSRSHVDDRAAADGHAQHRGRASCRPRDPARRRRAPRVARVPSDATDRLGRLDGRRGDRRGLADAQGWGWKIQTPESRSEARTYFWPFGCSWTSTPQKLVPCWVTALPLVVVIPSPAMKTPSWVSWPSSE